MNKKIEIIGPAKTHITIRHLLTHTSGLQGGPLGEYVIKRIPSEMRTCLEQTVKYFVMKNDKENRGLGVRVVREYPDNILPGGSFGWSGAYGSHFWVDPVNEIVAIYLKNSKYDGGSGSSTGLKFEKDIYHSFLS